ncbi:TonB-dependent receptor [Antarcticibacterium sp. 1MA-6-2]|uniref:TonB-dependent receptor n=1 Tax=Antarcticibacterium sp. 1MA-6-2 TaxID=2908210 RepID=UPI002104A72F|nr:TonB-dependent receptor [Antarcticibacterium sp. 1MA-6-2]
MIIPRVINANGFLELRESSSFWDINLKLEQHIDITENFHINLSAGVQNALNAYQDDFDSGPTRDSDYIYGPARPRTFFFGIKIGNLHN